MHGWPNGDTVTTLDYQVAASADDGYGSGANISNSGMLLYFGQTIGKAYTTYVRWDGVTIPDGATIDEAYISMRYDNKYGTPPTCTIYFEDDDDPAVIANKADLDGRTKTTANVSWAAPSKGTWVNTGSIISIIEELMASYSYASGAAMQMLVVGPQGGSTSNYSTIRSYDYMGNDQGPILHIKYSTGYVHSQCIII